MARCKRTLDLRNPSAADCARAAREPAAGADGPRRVYLDNAATTRVLPEVAEAMRGVLVDRPGNPSSLHGAGREARRLLEDARAGVARHLGAGPPEVLFTSGGTEADNLALFGVADALRGKGRHVVTSAVEHPAVLAAARALEADGGGSRWSAWTARDGCRRTTSSAPSGTTPSSSPSCSPTTRPA